jgi:hypothetical protein
MKELKVNEQRYLKFMFEALRAGDGIRADLQDGIAASPLPRVRLNAIFYSSNVLVNGTRIYKLVIVFLIYALTK